MSSDNLPVVRQNQPIVHKKVTDGEIADSRSRDHPPDRLYSSLSSLAGQVVKTAVYAAFDWLSERRASNRRLIDRGDKELNNTPRTLISSSGEMRGRHSVMKGSNRFNRGGNFKSQRSRSNGRRIHRRKRRWRQNA